MRRTAQSRFIHQRVCFRKRVDVALQQLFGRRGNRIGFGHRGGQQFDLLALPFLLDAQRKLHLKFLIPLQLQHLAKRNTLVKLTWQASAKSVMDRKRTALEFCSV